MDRSKARSSYMHTHSYLPIRMNSSTRVENLIPLTQDFDVDNQTGFMPPRLPIVRLPGMWEPWESILDAAIDTKLQLGDKIGLTEVEAEVSRDWRAKVRQVRTADLANVVGDVIARRCQCCRLGTWRNLQNSCAVHTLC